MIKNPLIIWGDLKVFVNSRPISGCSSARLEYSSGGRVVAGSNPVTPTDRKANNLNDYKPFLFEQFLSNLIMP